MKCVEVGMEFIQNCVDFWTEFRNKMDLLSWKCVIPQEWIDTLVYEYELNGSTLIVRYYSLNGPIFEKNFKGTTE